MTDMLETKKYTFTVEGETERWYLLWLRDRINEQEGKEYKVAIEPKVQQHPMKFAKGVNAISTPEVIHICDAESKTAIHVEKFRSILNELKAAKTEKHISYGLGYSNYTFELWIVLHKKKCNGSLTDRTQYLSHINHIFGEKFENLDQYKHENNFKRCLSKLGLDDVRAAIQRAKEIMKMNKDNGKSLIRHGGYEYYEDNPALTMHEAVEKILVECGLY